MPNFLLSGGIILQDGNYPDNRDFEEESYESEITNQNEYYRNDYDEPSAASYLTGALGAFIGAAVGIIPWAIVLYLGWIFSYLAFIVGFASFFGYALFKGPKDRLYGKIFIFSFSIVLILFMNFGIVTIDMYKEQIPITLENLFYVFAFLIKDFGFLFDLLISLVMGILGLRRVLAMVDNYCEE